MVSVLEQKNVFRKTSDFFKGLGFKKTISLFFVLIISGGFFVTYYLLGIQQDIRQRAAGPTTLTVNAANPIRKFTPGNLGMAYVNWEYSWNKPYINQVPGLAQAAKEAHMGMIRYAGGLWANWVGFDVTKKTPNPYTNWVNNGMTYSFNYGTDELDSLQAFGQATGADIMIQVNISNNDPDMWANMVRYTNAPGKYKIKYWEMGNELDLEQTQAPDRYVSPADYATRMVTYQQKMLAVDPTIKFVGAAQAFPAPQNNSNGTLSDYFFLPFQATKNAGHVMDGATYHWYMQCNDSTLADVLRYRWYNTDGTTLNPPTLWNNAYSRYWAESMPSAVSSQLISLYPGTQQGITELNYDACNYNSVYNSNHINALWFSDVLGRLAYNGVDFITAYEGYGDQAYSVLYADNDGAPTKIYPRPSYYAFLMYAKYFGDQMVESHSYKDDDISIWASTDSKDPGKLKLRITNLTANDITVPVNLSGFTALDGKVYTLASDNPTDTSSYSNTWQASTNINGQTIDAMNVAQSVANINGIPIVVNGSSFTYTFPAYSSTAIILNQWQPGTSPAPTLPPQPTPTPRIYNVSGLTLVDASSNTDLKTLTGGDAIDLSGMVNTCMSIRADTLPQIVGSVLFGYDGNGSYHTENTYPYYIGGVSGNNPYCWTLTNGNHTVSASAYTAGNLIGNAGPVVSKTFTVTNASIPPPASTSLVIFDGSTSSLSNGWGDCSWGGTVNYSNTSPTYNNAQYSIRENMPQWAAFSLCPNPFLKPWGYGALDMWVQGTGPGAAFTVSTAAMGQANAPSVGASKYITGGDVSFVPGKWEHVVIPFNTLNISTQGQVFRFYLTGAGGTTPPDIIFGRISFTPRVDTPTPTPTPPASALLLYDPQSGSPANGFFDNSWGTGESTTYNNTSPLRSGAYSVKAVLPPFTNFSLSDWGDPVSTAGYKALDVWLQAASNTTHISTQIDRSSGGNGNVNAEQYLVGGTSFTPGQWQHVQIPLSALGACNTAISEVHMLGGSNNPTSPPPFYFDTISLIPGIDSNCPGSPTATPTSVSTPTPSPTIAASPTPTPPASPTPTPSFTPGDMNHDGKVNVQDLSYMLSHWGTNDTLSDLNHSGKVDVLDLSILLSNWKP